MRLRLIIDAIPHEIDSTDPDLLARWIVEIFGRIPQIYPATLIEVQAQPSFVAADPADPSRPWQPDWIADSRVICQTQRIRSPRDLVKALTEQLDKLDALHDDADD